MSQHIDVPNRVQAQSNGERRRRLYVDDRIQGRLIAALLSLEIILFSAAMWYVYYDLNLLIEEQMYRIHMEPQEDGLPFLLMELLIITPCIIVANIIAVLVINRIWANYVSQIVNPLKVILSAVDKLDLRDRPDINTNHEVLEKAQVWLREEHRRCRKIQQPATKLDADMASTDLKQTLHKINKLLPLPLHATKI